MPETSDAVKSSPPLEGMTSPADLIQSDAVVSPLLVGPQGTFPARSVSSDRSQSQSGECNYSTAPGVIGL